jgi:cysteine-rich repeat protein
VPTATPTRTPTPAPTRDARADRDARAHRDAPRPPALPTPTPRHPTCGDGFVDRPGEECDDGNLSARDGCTSTCKFEVGVYCTLSQGGWGQTCKNGNPGCIRDSGFPAVFPSGLRIGDPAGPDGPNHGYTALWRSSAAIDGYLPGGRSAGPLTGDLVDPASTPGGSLAAQLVGVKLDVGILGLPSSLRMLGCVVPALRGKTIAELVTAADVALAGGVAPAGATLSDLARALEIVNLNFDACSVNNHCLAAD